MNESLIIKEVNKNDKSLEILWKDGEKSNFHFLWLRDNCPKGMHPTARQRNFNFLTVSENIHPKTFNITNEGNLKIKWSEGNHISIFESKWLRKNCYNINNKKKYVSPYILWDKAIRNNMNNVTIECDKIMSSEEGLIDWLEKLHYYGFCLVKNAPTEKKSALKILNRISHIRETFFGSPFEVINIPNPNNTAYTAEALRNHTDLPYYEYSPGYQFLHCLVNDAEGGLSSVVDTFKVADYLKKNDKKSFDTLINIPVKFQNNDYTQNTIRIYHSPLITLTKDGDFNDVRFSIATMGAMDCQPDEMENFYVSYKKFAKLLHDEKFIVNFRLTAGDIFSFNNRRVLHGRTEFNPNSGHRHLQGYYMDRDEIIARLNFLKKVEL